MTLRARLKLLSKLLLALLFVASGAMHFVRPEFYTAMMPAYLPYHLELVYLSGVIEIALGALLLVPRLTWIAAWGLIALLVAVFPANLNMALHPEAFPDVSPEALWVRLPIQGLLIFWVYVFTKRT